MVGEVRGVGLIGAIELTEDRATRKPFEPIGRAGNLCREICFANDLIMRSVRDAMVFSPPLTITKPEIDEFVARTKRCIDETAKQLGML